MAKKFTPPKKPSRLVIFSAIAIIIFLISPYISFMLLDISVNIFGHLRLSLILFRIQTALTLFFILFFIYSRKWKSAVFVLLVGVMLIPLHSKGLRFIELQQRKAEVTRVKSTFNVKEPQFLPSYMKKIGEYASGERFNTLYEGGLMITQAKGKTVFPDTLLSSDRIVSIENVNVWISSSRKEFYDIRFDHNGIVYLVSYSHLGSDSKYPLLSEEELLKIVESLIKETEN